MKIMMLVTLPLFVALAVWETITVIGPTKGLCKTGFFVSAYFVDCVSSCLFFYVMRRIAGYLNKIADRAISGAYDDQTL
jgi:hypothetical protein